MNQSNAPNPEFNYGGATNSQAVNLCGSITVGQTTELPFEAQSPGTPLGVEISETTDEQGSPLYELHVLSKQSTGDNPPTVEYYANYEQNGTEWEMTFQLISDKDGGVVGTEFSLNVESNHPDIKMSIPRMTIPQAGFSLLKRNTLPADYQARLTVNFWQNDIDVPDDGWIEIQVAYVKEDAPNAITVQVDGTGTPIVPVGTIRLYPNLLE